MFFFRLLQLHSTTRNNNNSNNNSNTLTFLTKSNNSSYPIDISSQQMKGKKEKKYGQLKSTQTLDPWPFFDRPI